MDVAGVAAASIISQYLSAFLILRALVKVGGDYALRLSKLRFDKRMAGYLIQIGLPAGLQNGIFQVANLFIQAGVNTFDATMVAGNSAAANADALLYDSMAAFYTACGSFMGQNYGAGKKKKSAKQLSGQPGLFLWNWNYRWYCTGYLRQTVPGSFYQ